MDEWRDKPNLFIVGAPKCGTTAWYKYLETHPDICLSSPKEPHFFASDFPGFRQATSLGAYKQCFAGCGDAKVIGEASTLYLYSKAAPRAVRDFNPDAKILIFLRSQEQFLPSWHNQLLFTYDEKVRDFSKVWAMSGNRPKRTIPRTCRDPAVLNYAAIGRFGEQVERYLDLFPREQVKVVRFADWSADPRRFYLELLEFLGLEDDRRREFQMFNPARQTRIPFLPLLIERPPPWFLKTLSTVKRVIRQDKLGLAPKIRRWAYRFARPAVDPKTIGAIRRYYEEDNRKLELLLRESECRRADES